MDKRLKTHDIRTWEKHLFLDISSTTLSHFAHKEKRTTKRCSSVLYFSSTVAILNNETSL
jgi:hypothetical protein